VRFPLHEAVEALAGVCMGLHALQHLPVAFVSGVMVPVVARIEAKYADMVESEEAALEFDG
jgi:hypothetical protein